MKHKKQHYENVERTLIWNTSRGNTPSTLNWDLETNMLSEELHEIAIATSEANRLKEVLDVIFIAYGSLGKMNLSSQDIVDSYELVVQSNESKSSAKNSDGKITKNTDFVPVEPLLQLILDRR